MFALLWTTINHYLHYSNQTDPYPGDVPPLLAAARGNHELCEEVIDAYYAIVPFELNDLQTRLEEPFYPMKMLTSEPRSCIYNLCSKLSHGFLATTQWHVLIEQRDNASSLTAIFCEIQARS
jgi:hypothetical protein